MNEYTGKSVIEPLYTRKQLKDMQWKGPTIGSRQVSRPLQVLVEWAVSPKTTYSEFTYYYCPINMTILLLQYALLHVITIQLTESTLDSPFSCSSLA